MIDAEPTNTRPHERLNTEKIDNRPLNELIFTQIEWKMTEEERQAK